MQHARKKANKHRRFCTQQEAETGSVIRVDSATIIVWSRLIPYVTALLLPYIRQKWSLQQHCRDIQGEEGEAGWCGEGSEGC